MTSRPWQKKTIQDVLPEVAPETEEEKNRVMHKSYSLDMFDERPMKWKVPNNQGALASTKNLSWKFGLIEIQTGGGEHALDLRFWFGTT